MCALSVDGSLRVHWQKRGNEMMEPYFVKTDRLLSGRFVDENGSPALLYSYVFEDLAILSVYSYGFWPIFGSEAGFIQTRSIVWYRGSNQVLFFRMYDADGCDLEMRYTCDELDDYLFPTEAVDAATIMGGWLDLDIYDPKIHEFDESVIDDTERFNEVWSQYSSLSVIHFKSPRPILHEE